MTITMSMYRLVVLRCMWMENGELFAMLPLTFWMLTLPAVNWDSLDMQLLTMLQTWGMHKYFKHISVIFTCFDSIQLQFRSNRPAGKS